MKLFFLQWERQAHCRINFLVSHMRSALFCWFWEPWHVVSLLSVCLICSPPSLLSGSSFSLPLLSLSCFILFYSFSLVKVLVLKGSFDGSLGQAASLDRPNDGKPSGLLECGVLAAPSLHAQVLGSPGPPFVPTSLGLLAASEVRVLPPACSQSCPKD